MTNTSSQADARERITQYFVDTLAGLPKEVWLSRRHPVYPHAKLSGGSVGSIVDEDPTGNAPVNFGVGYWVVGVPDSGGAVFVDKFIEVWTAMGLLVERDADEPDKTVRATTSDNYTMMITTSKAGSLSLSATSSSFPREGIDRQPMPRDIPHPASDFPV